MLGAVNVKVIWSGVYFAASVVQLVLCLYASLLGTAKKRKILDFILLVTLSFATAYLAATAVSDHYAEIPIAALYAVVPCFVYSIAGVLYEFFKSKKRLTSNSIKETLDNLDSAVCFADKNGKIVLINYKMSELASRLLGEYPQTLSQILTALQTVQAIDKQLSIYKFSDDKIWRFSTVELKDPEGYTQTTAQDVTAIYLANEKLETENAELKKIISEIKLLYVRLADRIREQEALNLKMRLHNEIGASLISISQMTLEPASDVESQVKKLQSAVWYLANVDVERSSLERARRQAEEIGVRLEYRGEIPAEDRLKDLFALITQECVSNCVNHAKGNEVVFDISENGDVYSVIVTNNGENPTEKIREGGGLSSLRYSVEKEGGSMTIASEPRFAITLTLPKGEK